MSIGLVNEVAAALDIAIDIDYLNKNNYEELLQKAESIVKRLSGFSKKLKASK